MEIKWLDSALDNLLSLKSYIAQDKPKAAKQTVEKFFHFVDNLAEHPFMGRAGRIYGTRELIISSLPFIIVYCVKQDKIEILNVLHQSIDWT